MSAEKENLKCHYMSLDVEEIRPASGNIEAGVLIQTATRHPDGSKSLGAKIWVIPGDTLRFPDSQKDDLLRACINYHQACDILMARLIMEVPGFFPSMSGAPWDAVTNGKAAIEAAGGKL